jgi:hypothetical protein
MHLFIIILTALLLHLPASQENPAVVPFNSAIISPFPNVRDFTISSAMDEAYFTVQSPMSELSAIAKIQKNNGKWSEPQIAAFSGQYSDMEPFLSVDELRLYFVSNRPISNSDSGAKDYDIWYVERAAKDAAWSTPLNPGEPINTKHNEFYPSLSANNNMYFTSDAPASRGKDDIFFSTWENDHYSSPISLSEAINTEGYEFNAFISAEESFLIFTGYNRPDGLGSGDLYISYRKNGKWQPAQNLGKNINSDKMDYCPFVHKQSKTLFFTSKRSKLNKHQGSFSNMKEFLSTINSYENGLSRIYKVKFEKYLQKQD